MTDDQDRERRRLAYRQAGFAVARHAQGRVLGALTLQPPAAEEDDSGRRWPVDLGSGARHRLELEILAQWAGLMSEASAAAEATTVAVIEANIDDSTPEVLGFAMERLLAAGALDVTLAPLLMKKNRPGTLVTVIARPEQRDGLAQILFAETSTLGMRMYEAERRVQAREWIEVETPHGRVRIKVARDGNFAPEYDDCRRLALESGVPLKEILAEASAAYLKTK